MAENQPETIVVGYDKFLGLRSGRHVSLPFSKEGVGFQTANNCELTSDGKLQRRKGYSLLQSIDYHSIFPDGDKYFLAEKGGNLVRVKVDSLQSSVEEVVLKSNIGSNPVTYIDTMMGIYFTNGILIGKVVGGIYTAFPTITTQYKATIPAGDMIEFFNSTLYVVKGKYLYISDPYIYYRFDERNGVFSFPANITMVAEVGSGLFVGTEEKVYFLQGTSPKEMTLVKRLDYSSIKGTQIKLKGVKVLENYYFNGVIFATPKGICIGGEDGNIINVTENNYTETIDGTLGVSEMYQEDDVNQIIFVLK